MRLTVGRLRRLALAGTGRLTLRLSVDEAALVTVSFRVGNRRLTAAGRSRVLRFRRRGGKRVTLRLDPATRARLRRSRKVRVEIRTTARDAAGNRRDQRIVRALR